MYSFRNDYSEGAHPKVLQALADTNLRQTVGYGMDPCCQAAADTIRRLCAAPDAAETDDKLTLVAFNVGKADALLLTSGDTAYLIDTGTEDSWADLSRALEALGVTRLCLLYTSDAADE